MFKGWVWLLVAVGVVWYLSEREKQSLAIAANRGATGAVDSAGRAITGAIDQAGPAFGKWLSGLFSGGSTSTSSPGSSGSGNSVSVNTSSYAYTPDEQASAYGGADEAYI